WWRGTAAQAANATATAWTANAAVSISNARAAGSCLAAGHGGAGRQRYDDCLDSQRRGFDQQRAGTAGS
ncbi:hypothetical protein, partial [Nocardia brasiliensis]|uniref:hypothetical protein n=1 Tax=Nocardia brasiliensis TaxID=37326 RepID=UPI0033FC6E75